MSAIAGIHFRDKRRVSDLHISRMLSAMRHRGPNRVGLWSDGSVGLGHCLLHTTPESLRESLPAWNSSPPFVVTADCRIDNRGELLSSLEISGDSRPETSDSALVVRAYEKWGEACLERLLGDFAFAIWDGPKRTLFCARDHFGVKPFYYCHSNRGFFFASEIKALLCLAEVPCRLNEARIADFIASDFHNTSATFYRDIFRLPPAHRLTVRRGELSLRRYWTLDPSRDIRCRSDADYAEGFRTIFTNAVRTRLRSAFPVGAMLSGGLDSSSIVCVARQILERRDDRKLHTFSVVFPNAPECDESPYIGAVIDGGGIEPHFVDAQKLSPLGNMECMLRHEDEPFFAPNLFLHCALYAAAQGQRVRILLDGIDGDTTVSHGIGMLQELLRKGRWLALARETAGLSRRLKRPATTILRNQILGPFLSAAVSRARQLVGHKRPPTSTLLALLNRDFASRLRGTQPQWEVSGWSRWRNSRQEHYSRLSQGILPYILEVADYTAAAFRVEPRYPFFDKRLVEYCLALPGEQKLFRGWTRMVMRRSMATILPEGVRWRGDKSDLSPNFLRSLIRNDTKVLDEMILSVGSPVWEYVDSKRLQSIYSRAVSSDDREAALSLWKVATLNCWLRSFNSRSWDSGHASKNITTAVPTEASGIFTTAPARN